MALKWISVLNQPPSFNLLHTEHSIIFCFFKDGLLLGNYTHLSEWKGFS